MAKTLKQIHDQFGFPFVAKQVDSDPENHWHNRPLRFTKDDGPDWMHSDEGSFVNNWDGWEEVVDEPSPLEKAEPTIEDLQSEIEDLRAKLTESQENIQQLQARNSVLEHRLSDMREDNRKKRRLLEHAETFRSVVANISFPEDFSARGMATQDPKMMVLRMAAKVYRDACEVD